MTYLRIYTLIILFCQVSLFGQTPCISTCGIAGSTTVCSGSNSGTITLTGYTGSVLRWEFTTASTPSAVWSVLSGNQTYVVNYTDLIATTYYRAYIQNGTCSADYSPVATIVASPLSNGGHLVADTASVCYGSNISQLTLSGQTGAILYWEYSVNNGTDWNFVMSEKASLIVNNLTNSTFYRVTVKSGECEQSISDTMSITVNPLPIADFEAPPACYGKYTLLKSTSTVAAGTVKTFLWDLDDGSRSSLSELSKKYKSTGIYNVELEVTTNKGCKDTITKEVHINELPKAGFEYSNACIGNENTFKSTASISNEQTLNYLWSFGDGSESILGAPNHKYTAAGQYEVTLYVFSAIDECIDSAKQFIEVYSLPIADAGKDTTAIYNVAYTLIATGGVKYYWQPSDLVSMPDVYNPQIVLTKNTTFFVRVTDVNGCIANDSVTIQVSLNEQIYPSNIITPDDNGQNDKWVIKNIEAYPNCEVHIFDCRGQEVYFTQNYQNDWDGRNKSNDVLPDGSYYYVIRFPLSELVYKGVITLLRKNK